jgi:hypothetical protein
LDVRRERAGREQPAQGAVHGGVRDVLDDVAGHLAEVAGEFEQEPTAQTLQERLGTPRQYADELRTAAGYPPSPGKPSGDKAAEIKAGESALRWGVVACLVGPFFLIIALLGTGLGLGVGLFFGWALVTALREEGFDTFHVPVGQLAVIAVIGALAGVTAAVLPARKASRLDTLRAISAA